MVGEILSSTVIKTEKSPGFFSLRGKSGMVEYVESSWFEPPIKHKKHSTQVSFQEIIVFFLTVFDISDQGFKLVVRS